MPTDKWGHPYFYPSKVGGFKWEMKDDIEDDSHIHLDGLTNTGTGTFTIHFSGPTSPDIFSDPAFENANSIGGCNMNFEDTEDRGYIYKPNDPRDIELKFVAKFSGFGDNGFSISGPTGDHSGDGCCSGFSYMFSCEPSLNPCQFRFRKEMWHVSYHDHSSGNWTNSKINFKLNDHGYVGIAYVRYNKKDGRSAGHDSVILEGWMNPTPDTNKNNWILLKRIEDKGGWGNDGDDCGGVRDQVGTWGGPKYRIKSNDEGSDITFKHMSLREINPSLGFDDTPDPTPTPPSSTVRKIYYATAKGVTEDYFQYTKTITEETVESCTDPDPFKKFGKKSFHAPSTPRSSEIGDLCDGVFGEYPDGLDVKAYWSNNDKNCVVPHISEVDLGGSTLISNPEGGPVLKNAKIYLVFWGTDWPTRGSPPTMGGLTDRIQNRLLGTDVEYFTKLSQYGGVEAPTWGGAVSNTTFPVPSSGSLNKTMVEQVLTDSFNKGLLAMPAEVNENIYHVILPVGRTVVSGSGSGELVGGFHDVYKTSITVAPPPTGGGGEGEVTTSIVTGTFRFNQDINTLRISPCAGTGSGSAPASGGGTSEDEEEKPEEPGGGTPEETGGAKFYQVTSTSHNTELSDTATFQNRTRGGEQCANSSSPMKGKVLKQLDVWLRKVGSGGSGFIFAKIWSSNGSTRYTSPTQINPTTLSTSFTKKIFDFSGNTLAINTGDVVGVNYAGTSDTDYVEFAYHDNVVANCIYVNYENGAWEPKPTTRDFTAQMWD